MHPSGAIRAAGCEVMSAIGVIASDKSVCARVRSDEAIQICFCGKTLDCFAYARNDGRRPSGVTEVRAASFPGSQRAPKFGCHRNSLSTYREIR